MPLYLAKWEPQIIQKMMVWHCFDGDLTVRHGDLSFPGELARFSRHSGCINPICHKHDMFSYLQGDDFFQQLDQFCLCVF